MILENLPEEEPITFPAVMNAKELIGKSIVATRENYEDLINLLHQLTVSANTDISLSRKEKIEKQIRYSNVRNC